MKIRFKPGTVSVICSTVYMALSVILHLVLRVLVLSFSALFSLFHEWLLAMFSFSFILFLII